MSEPVQEPESEEASGRRTMDPELRCMSAILRMLDDLDDKARGRVVAYLRNRFEP